MHCSNCASMNIMLSLISLCLLSTTLAVPSPQAGHDHSAKAPPGANILDMLWGGLARLIPPLPLYKITNAEKPEFAVPGIVREQLYYGPLVLQPAAVRPLQQTLKVSKVYNAI